MGLSVADCGHAHGHIMTFSGNLFGAAITAESIRKVIRVGTILERPTDGVQVKVASVAGLSATVAAYGNTVLSDDAAGYRLGHHRRSMVRLS